MYAVRLVIMKFIKNYQIKFWEPDMFPKHCLMKTKTIDTVYNNSALSEIFSYIESVPKRCMQL